jgi:hypothetical protein
MSGTTSSVVMLVGGSMGSIWRNWAVQSDEAQSNRWGDSLGFVTFCHEPCRASSHYGVPSLYPLTAHIPEDLWDLYLGGFSQIFSSEGT